MELSQLRLSLENVSRRPEDDFLEITEVRAELDFTENSRERKQIGFRLNCLACKGAILTVKLPMQAESTLKKVRQMLDNDQIVRAKFQNLTIRAYAMPVSTGFRSGVSAKAESLEILPGDDWIIEA